MKQLIFRLLQRDPKKRLGCFEGANEVKNHSFFKGINWALIRCTVSNFRKFSLLGIQETVLLVKEEKQTFNEFVLILQNAPELETPIFSSEAVNKEEVVNPEMEDLQSNVF